MIIVRNTFQMKYGKAREVRELWKEGKSIMEGMPNHPPARAMMDLTGPSYTFVLENTFDSLAAMEQEMPIVFGNPKWHAWYMKFTELIVSGDRVIFSVVD